MPTLIVDTMTTLPRLSVRSEGVPTPLRLQDVQLECAIELGFAPYVPETAALMGPPQTEAAAAFRARRPEPAGTLSCCFKKKRHMA